MPLYLCSAQKDTVTAAAKQQIAKDITAIHCEVTGAPPSFVHVAFFEDSPLFPLEDKALVVMGTIRMGRTPEQMEEITTAIRRSLATHGGVEVALTEAHLRETPASWVLEGGEIMPEPGEEAAWFAAHEARCHQEST